MVRLKTFAFFCVNSPVQLWLTIGMIFLSFRNFQARRNLRLTASSFRAVFAPREGVDLAVEEVAATARRLIASLVTHAEPRRREVEAEKARLRSAARFGAGNQA